MRNACIAELTNISKDNRVYTMVADNGIIVFDEHVKLYPDQFLNVGIAESNMVGVAAGMATCGFIPFVYTIIPFLTMRAFEFIRNDICEQDLNVKVIGIGAGFAYSSLGPTHHGTEDISIMRCLPNLKVICPADPMETRKAIHAAYETKGPVYIRIGTGKNPAVYKNDYDFRIGQAITLKDGKDITVFVTGTIAHDVLETALALEKRGISARVINIHTIKPIDEEAVLKAARETKAVITVEEHSIVGALGSAVAEVILEKCDKSVKFKRMGLNDVFCDRYGSVQDLRQIHGLSSEALVKNINQLLG